MFFFFDIILIPNKHATNCIYFPFFFLKLDTNTKNSMASKNSCFGLNNGMTQQFLSIVNSAADKCIVDDGAHVSDFCKNKTK